MSGVEWDDAQTSGSDAAGRVYRVGRHGAGRSHWDAALPDGSTSTLTSKKAALEACEDFAEQFPPQLLGQEDLTVELAQEAEDPDVQLRATLVRLALDVDGGRPAPKKQGYYSGGGTGAEQTKALKVIRGLAGTRAALEREMQAQVDAARLNTGSSWYSNAATWDLVGEALGVSKQSASTRYGVKKD